MTTTDEALKEAVMQVAKAKVAEAMGGDVLGKMIEAVMNHREKGYGRDRDDRTEFEKIVERHIAQAIDEAVRAHLAAYTEQVKAAVRSAMEAKMDAFAASIVDAFAGEDWRATLQVEIKRGD